MRRHWRQQDLATESGVSRSLVARIEVGQSDAIPVGKLEKVASAVGARADLRLNWNGEALDRLLDAAHAGLVELTAAKLRAIGWEVAAEVTFWIRGERGSVDLLAWHPTLRLILVIEVKSIVPDIQAMLTSLDRKARLANEIARSRGLSPIASGRLLVIGESRTSRRRVEKHAATFAAEFPHRGASLKGWLRAPNVAPPLRGLWFMPTAHAVRTRHRVPKS
jgi:transcriptional regulator with XRE-family HTH domain